VVNKKLEHDSIQKQNDVNIAQMINH